MSHIAGSTTRTAASRSLPSPGLPLFNRGARGRPPPHWPLMGLANSGDSQARCRSALLLGTRTTGSAHATKKLSTLRVASQPPGRVRRRGLHAEWARANVPVTSKRVNAPPRSLLNVIAQLHVAIRACRSDRKVDRGGRGALPGAVAPRRSRFSRRELAAVTVGVVAAAVVNAALRAVRIPLVFDRACRIDRALARLEGAVASSRGHGCCSPGT